jgi:MFS family permease
MKRRRAAVGASPPLPTTPSRAYSAYALGLLALLNLLNYLDRNIIFALFEPIKRDLGFSDAQLGWVGSAYIIVFSVAALPLGVLSDLRSRRAVIAGGVFLWSLSTALSGLARGFWQMFSFRAAVGIGEAAYGPAAQSLVADYYPGRGRAIAMSLLASGIALGGVLGILLGGAIEEIWGWRGAFFVAAVPGFVLALLVARLRDPTRPPAPISVRRSLRQFEIGLFKLLEQCVPLLVGAYIGGVAALVLHSVYGADSSLDAAALAIGITLGLAVNIVFWVRKIRAQDLKDSAFVGGVSTTWDEIIGAVHTVMRTPSLVFMFIGGALISFGNNGLVGWAPTFTARELGLTPAESAVLLGKWGLISGTAGTLFGGVVAEWLGRYTEKARVLVTGVGHTIGGALALWLLTIRDLELFVPVFAAAFFCLTWYNGPMAAAIFDVVPARIGATVMGGYLLFIHLAGDAIALPLVGTLSDSFGLDRAILVLPAAAFLGGLVIFGSARTVKRDMAWVLSRTTTSHPVVKVPAT